MPTYKQGTIISVDATILVPPAKSKLVFKVRVPNVPADQSYDFEGEKIKLEETFGIVIEDSHDQHSTTIPDLKNRQCIVDVDFPYQFVKLL